MPALERFIADYPDSPWVPSLRANLGRYCYENGLYTRALEHWRAAWDATRTAESSPAKNVADFTFAYWTRLLGSLGRTETLRTLFQETDGRIFDNGPLQQIVNATKEGYRMMQSDPGVCFKCGTYALSSIARILKGPSADTRQILSVPSPRSGFSMTELVELSKRSDLDLVPAEWSKEKALVVPSIVHWKEDHYAALLEEKNGGYLVMDPTFGKPRWLSPDAIQQEASGFFLVPKDRITSGWKILASADTDKIHGRGYVWDANDPNDGCGNGSGGGAGGGGGGGGGGKQGISSGSSIMAGDCASCGGGNNGGNGGPGGAGGGSGGGCCGDDSGGSGNQGGNSDPKTAQAGGGDVMAGSPIWEGSEPYISVWLYDRPVGTYQPGIGYPVNFKMAYKQRETRTFSPNFFGFGKLWDSSWLTYISDEPRYRISMTMAVPGGGERTYTPDGTTREYFSNTTMQRTTDGSDNLTGFIISYASGAIDYYQYVPTNLLDAVQVAYLSEKVDPAGHTNRYIYQETNDIVFLKFVIDADRHTNTLFYTNATFPSYVTGIQDPFGRMAAIKYDENPGSINYGMATSIVDVISLASSFNYDSQGWVTNLNTPYGTTLFQYATNTDNYGTEFDDNQPYTFLRAVRVIDPAQGTNIYMLRQESDLIYTNVYDAYTNSGNYLTFLPYSYDSSVVPSGVPTSTLDNTYLYYRDSFHWGPRQATGLPLDFTTFTPSNFKEARMSHWLHDRVHFNLGQTLDMQQEPSPDGIHDGQTTWFDYDGKSATYQEGNCSLPSLIARVLPDGTTWYRWFRRDEWARATNVVETYSTGFGDTPLTRTNIYFYNGSDLVKHIGPRGEVVAGYAYDGNHDIIRMTNAVNDVWYYTLDAQGRLTSTKTPAGLTTTNLYPAAGDYTNFVQTRIDLEINRTNSFTYTNDLVYTHTDERGLITTNTYDALSRLITSSDSRGTISNTYDKLDLAQVVDRMNFTNRYVFDAVRRMTAHTNALGRFTLYNRCTCGSLDSIRDFEGNYTYYFYDNAGRLLNTAFADNYSTTNNFNLIGQITNTIDSAAYSVTNWFNNQGLLYAVTTAAGNREYIDFDDEDHATNVVNTEGVSTAMIYDDLGRVRSRAYFDGTEYFGYSPNGLVAYTNQIGPSNFFAYDAAGRKTFETNGNNELIRYTNNAAGDLVSLTDGKTQTTIWHYDQYGRVTNKLDQSGVEILRYKYDPNNRLTNRWSAAKGETRYSYDAVGNLLTINYPLSGTINFLFDSMNRMTNMVDGLGTTKYTYSAAGQLLTEDGPFASDTVTNVYSNRLRTGLGLQQPTGSWTNGFAYDSTKRLTNVTCSAGAFGYLYESGLFTHHSSRVTLPNTSYITNVFDADARLTSTYLYKSDNTTFDSYAYVYNPANQRTNLTRADSSTVGYKYDNIGQLKVADSSVNTDDSGYTYDSAWNLKYRTNNGVLSTFTVDNKNQLTNYTGLAGIQSYDSNGNLVVGRVLEHQRWTYSYDDENRLILLVNSNNAGTVVFSATKFIYDGLGRLRERLEYNTALVIVSQTHYIYDGWRVIQERNGTNNTPTVSYTRGNDLSGTMEGAGGIGGLLARSDGYSGGNFTTHNFYFADGNGNITYMLNSSQSMVASYRYDPFGNTISSSGTLATNNVYRFSSKEIHVNSGMYYYGYRFYDPNLQRWINRDPIEEVGGMNLYACVYNDPLNTFDSLGLEQVGQTVPQPYPLFPTNPASSDKNRVQVPNTSGNAPPVRPARPPRPCSPIGAKTPKRSGGTETKECRCTGTHSVDCTDYDECVFWSMGLNGQQQGSWKTHHDCPCPEDAT